LFNILITSIKIRRQKIQRILRIFLQKSLTVEKGLTS